MCTKVPIQNAAQLDNEMIKYPFAKGAKRQNWHLKSNNTSKILLELFI